MEKDLNRFLEAQRSNYNIALEEIKNGRKINHWIWYIFPQIKGLGSSWYSQYYGIKDIDEAKDYLKHPILGGRLKEISNALLQLDQTDAKIIFGGLDAMKVKSCMTLFAEISDTEDNIFKNVIEKFYNGKFDHKTLNLIR